MVIFAMLKARFGYGNNDALLEIYLVAAVNKGAAIKR